MRWIFGENGVGGLLGAGGVERRVNALVWGPPALALMLAVGVVLTLRCGAPQFTRFGPVLRRTLGGVGRGRRGGPGGVSPGKAMCTALAASIGTGNIAGVSGAIALGGPGAVFWMWVSALVGMGTKFAEVTLAVHYRQRGSRGEWVGGPMYYIQNGLGRRWRWLAWIFALFGGLAAFGIGNMTQVNTIAVSVDRAVAGAVSLTAGQRRALALAIGVVCAGITLAVLAGGAKRIGDVCALLVPVMALVYTAASLAVLICRREALPGAVGAIVRGAFRPEAVVGGAAGITLRSAVTSGVGRGVFSNEAGLGSAPIAHAAAETDHPAAQGLYGILEVFLDTIVGCTMTALVVLVGAEHIPYGQAAGAELAISGFSSVFGDSAAALVAVCLTLFALPTILTWGLYGGRCWAYLFGESAAAGYRVVFAGAVVLGAVMELRAVWNVADTLNALMALPNLLALLLLAPQAGKLARSYFSGGK